MSNNPFSCKYKLLASINRIRDIDGDQYQVKDAMEQIAKANLKCIQCEQVCKLLQILLKRNIGTNEVEKNVKRTLSTCTGVYQQTVKRKIMRMKLADAHKERVLSRHRYQNIMEEKRPTIPTNTWNIFVDKCRRYVPQYRRTYKKKHRTKINWLLQKYGNTEIRPPDEIQGVDL